MQRIHRVYRSKYFPFLLLIAFFVLPLLLYLSYYRQDLFLFAGDSYVPITRRDMYVAALSSGEIPFWNKLLSNGVPFADNVYKPFLLLTSFLSAKDYAYVMYALHLSIGATFMYLYLREIGCRGVVCVMTALLYELSVHLGGLRKEHSMVIEAIVYVPVILFLLHRYFKTERFGWLALSSAAMALQFYDGMIQYTLYADIAIFFYFLAMGIHSRHRLRRLLGEVLVLVLIYVGLIAPRLFSLADTMLQYSMSGAGKPDISYIQALSIHWLNLLIMLFPKFGGSVYMPLSQMYSSGIDIELFFGVAFCFILFVSMIRFRKNFYVRLCALMMLFAFVYAGNAHIPYLSELIYRIPILNGFRVPSRSLFLFHFFAYTLFAVSLTKILENEEYTRLAKTSVAYAALAVLGCIVVIDLWSTDVPVISERLKTAYPSLSTYFRTAFAPSLIVVALVVALCFAARFLLPRLRADKDRLASAVLCGFLTICTLVEVLPFSLETDASPFYQTQEAFDAVEEIASSIETHKAWTACPSFNIYQTDLTANNKNQTYGFATVSAYMSFNNPNLSKLFRSSSRPQMNVSGLYAYFPAAQRILFEQNDLLSMLGIKYIVDSSSLVAENGESVVKHMPQASTFFTKKRFDIEPAGLSVLSERLDEIPSDTLFEVSFTVDTAGAPKFLYVDFYSDGGQYDLEQNLFFTIKEGVHTYVGYVVTDTVPSSMKDAMVRIVAETEYPLTIEDFSIVELGPAESVLYQLPHLTVEPGELFQRGYDLGMLEDGALLEISFSAIANTEDPVEFFYIDLYGEDYDDSEQNVFFQIEEGEHTYTGHVYTGDVPEDRSVKVRVVAETNTPVELYDLSVIKVGTMTEGVYVPFIVNENIRVFENTNVREVLYVPDYVASVEDMDAFYQNSRWYNLSTTSYVQGIPDMDLSGADAVVTVDSFGYNSIEGHVTSQTPAYLNFSQNYYEGWQAYVNGERTPIHLTNGLIQGIEIPAGTSTVRFVYVPYPFYVGLAILGGTIACIVLGLVIQRKKRAKAARQEG